MNLLQLQGSPILRGGLKMRMGVGLLAALCFIPEAWAVFTYANVNVSRRSITLRVGTAAAGTIDNVIFNVTGPNVGAGATASTTPGVLVQVTVSKPLTSGTNKAQYLTVDSSAGLTCVAGSGCGSTVIPFTAISWVSTVQETGTYANWDVPSGTFNGGVQTLYSNNVNVGFEGTMTVTNTLAFTYANTTIYPSGQYTGRVTYTAASL